MTDSFTESERELAQWLKKEVHKHMEAADARKGTYIKDAWLLTARQLQKKMFEELSKEFYDLYHQLPKVDVWRASNDAVCDMCEDKVIEILKSHFLKDDEVKL